MLDVLAITIPFFAMIFLGAGSKAIGFITDDGTVMLSRFAFFIALPPFLFLNVASNDPAAFFNLGFLWRYEVATIKFWDEIAAESEIKAKVVEIFRRYNDDMQKAVRPYRYS